MYVVFLAEASFGTGFGARGRRARDAVSAPAGSFSTLSPEAAKPSHDDEASSSRERLRTVPPSVSAVRTIAHRRNQIVQRNLCSNVRTRHTFAVGVLLGVAVDVTTNGDFSIKEGVCPCQLIHE